MNEKQAGLATNPEDQDKTNKEFAKFFSKLQKEFPGCSKTRALNLFRIEQNKKLILLRERKHRKAIRNAEKKKRDSRLISLGALVAMVGKKAPKEMNFDMTKGLLGVSDEILTAVLAGAHAMLYTADPAKLQSLYDQGRAYLDANKQANKLRREERKTKKEQEHETD